jgi:hypothetical protein
MDGDSIAVAAPEVLAERVVELAFPLLGEETDDLVASREEEIAVSPDGVDGVCLRDSFGVARVPCVFCSLHLLRGRLGREGR